MSQLIIDNKLTISLSIVNWRSRGLNWKNPLMIQELVGVKTLYTLGFGVEEFKWAAKREYTKIWKITKDIGIN